MEQPIDEVLNSVALRLETVIRDPKVGADLAHQVRQYNKSYGKVLKEIRQCQNVVSNTDKIIYAFIPQGKKLAENIWSTIEAYGYWTTEAEEITDLLTKTFVIKSFAEDVVNSIISGCQCQIKPTS